MKLLELHSIFKRELSELYNSSEISCLWEIFGEHYLGLDKIGLRQSENTQLPSQPIVQYTEAINQLKSGKPYQQILGEADFFGMKFCVNQHVLIPRPETEELLDYAIKTISKEFSKQTEIKILDIGTGSGVIPIVLKKHFPNARIASIDFSKEALTIAKKNAEKHHTDIEFILNDYLNYTLPTHYDVIISNPPYIDIEEVSEISDTVKNFEPHLALFSPCADPLVFYRKIATDAKHHLNNGGFLFLEINQKLGAETLALYKDFSDAHLIKDLSNNDRMIIAKK
ncbi:peptide chain release factor N(5)-glutamine methyltransferase [Riemerella anatipestifer]|uniref:peptide chain release factor N(5)-glutamine methyltransferase n=1 Tax=Riemerella anatipestifer TaxID=34085 RepID=A0AAP6HCX3_RIEAN|nr:peptide chain release factor N(5)-glutamine methyltransferase [Riemerella anatipestifer]MBT0549847.1 peptide chain release factor N(5)-glutamine methyltransferase [Riemerella anatipestifer]MBT0556564.1 peptide chain release factor N(5)-glutamine methyltransferase [Riemerella anatipestifer]MBT0560615.1 peptide chain release factor N(5)-glutamine methyltransferase [Riemerella anatipestifer]MCD5969053.1 peptide chain release factor N(5)-glutamine methyltransferase [Riemerella anatipestifer]MCU